MAHFSAERYTDADIIIQVGDLFDIPHVPRDVVLAAARACLSAAENNPDVLFIDMAGNHDQPRNLSTVGAWPMFKKMVENRLPNLLVVDQPAVIEEIAILPWEWDRRADVQLGDLDGQKAQHAVGHWDLAVFDGDDSHLAPTRLLQAMFGEAVGIWSGHYHKAGPYVVDGVTVQCTGSMQPYAHGEGDMYVTLTREEALARDDLRDKCVRILLKRGEEMPEIDCLALTPKYADVTADPEVTVSLENFEFQKLIRDSIKERDPKVRSFIEERISLNDEATEE